MADSLKSSIRKHGAAVTSRRDFCVVCMLAQLSVLVGCRSTSPNPSSAELDTLFDAIAHYGTSQANLPGVRSLLALDTERLRQGFSESDLNILVGALYLEAGRQLADTRSATNLSDQTVAPVRRRPLTDADVLAVLSKPIDTSRFGHDYFLGLLTDAKTRLARDPQYRYQLEQAQGTARQKTCLGDTPRWICIGMGVILVLAIILLL